MKKKMLSMFLVLCMIGNSVFAIMPKTSQVISLNSVIELILNIIKIFCYLIASILLIYTIKKYNVLKKKTNSEGTKMKYRFVIRNIVIIIIIITIAVFTRLSSIDASGF